MVLKSMTGYGLAALASPFGNFKVEIQGVNRRFLEINLYAPRSLARFESAIRRCVEEKVGRGQVNISIRWEPSEKGISQIKINFPLAKTLHGAFRNLCEEFKLEGPKLEHFLKEDGIFLVEESEKEELLSYLKDAVNDALSAFVKMREEEGAFIAKDILGRHHTLSNLMDKIEKESFTLVPKFRERLEKRVASFFSKEKPEDEALLLKEIVLYTDKSDISEEILRFKSHLAQFKKLIEAREAGETKGKKFDFLIQELHREINTISSKSQEIEISRLAVDVKSELEKIREQVQNIE